MRSNHEAWLFVGASFMDGLWSSLNEVLHVETQRSLAGAACAHVGVHCGAGSCGASRAQPGTGRARTHADRFLALPGYRALRPRYVRELGERIPADGDVRFADGQPAPG